MLVGTMPPKAPLLFADSSLETQQIIQDMVDMAPTQTLSAFNTLRTSAPVTEIFNHRSAQSISNRKEFLAFLEYLQNEATKSMSASSCNVHN